MIYEVAAAVRETLNSLNDIVQSDEDEDISSHVRRLEQNDGTLTAVKFKSFGDYSKR